MTTDTLLHALEQTSAEFAILAEQRGIIPIATCAPWTTTELIVHLGQVYAMINDTITQRATAPLRPGPDSVAPTGDTSLSELLSWFRERQHTLLHTLSATDPNLEVWTWGQPPTVAFYIRRVTHETLVHLFDLDPQRGAPSLHIDRSIFCDGIDEYFEVVLPRTLQRLQKPLPQGSLHLHCTDGDGEWLVTIEHDTIVLTHEHAKATVAWRGSAANLFLTCWGRTHLDLEVLGDQEISDQWIAAAP
jgi:uncharacterized protein (TIGR03083 family)